MTIDTPMNTKPSHQNLLKNFFDVRTAVLSSRKPQSISCPIYNPPTTVRNISRCLTKPAKMTLSHIISPTPMANRQIHNWIMYFTKSSTVINFRSSTYTDLSLSYISKPPIHSIKNFTNLIFRTYICYLVFKLLNLISVKLFLKSA